jgi:glycosyltransferase involved in cell wall biosynthesis
VRLTILNQFYPPDLSPTAHLAASLAEHRAARGDEVTVVASQGGYVPEGALERDSREGNPRVYRAWTPRLGRGSRTRRILDYLAFLSSAGLRLLRLPAQDVIVSLTTPPYVALAALLHRLRHPRARIVLWSMDCYPEAAERLGALRPRSLAARLLRRLNRALFERIDHVVCLDAAMSGLLRAQYAPGRERDFTVIPNWESARLFPDPRPPVAEWPELARRGLAGRFVVLYLGNAGAGHEFASVIDAAGALGAEPVTFLFVGGGARYAWLENEKGRRGLENVVLAPYVPKEETPRVLAAAGCALIVLDDRALGVISPSKLHAALAMGVPVLYYGPAGSNVDEAITRFGCGASLRHGAVEEGVAFLRGLMGDPEAAQALGRAARRAFEEAYCDTVTLPAFDAVLDALAPAQPS